MSLPTSSEIREKATELFHTDRERMGLPIITPTDEELREGNYWLSARNELMRGYEGELEQALAMYEEEARNLREILGVPVTDEAKMEELEGKVINLESKLHRTREQLKTAREETARLEEELRRAREKPPPLIRLGLSEENKARLTDSFQRILLEAKVSPAKYLPILRDELKRLQEDLSRTPTEQAYPLAKAEIETLARGYIPIPRVEAPPPPPTPELEARVKRIEEAVKKITAPPRELPPREAIYATVIDWYDNQTLVPIDRDEIWRLRQLLHYDEHFYYLSPEHQRQIYGVDIRGAVKLAIFNERITRNHLADMGLNPEAYGV